MKRLLLPIAVLIPVLTGCGTLTPTLTPETTNERLLVLEHRYTVVLASVENAVLTGVVTGEDANKAVAMLNSVTLAVRTARTSIRMGIGDAEQYLATANSVLLELINYLAAKEAAKPKPVTLELTPLTGVAA